MTVKDSTPTTASPSTPPFPFFSSSNNKDEPRRLTSKANIFRQASASLLRTSITPSLSKKLSLINIFPEFAESKAITLYYASGWDNPCIHYKAFDVWTKPPGDEMTKATDKVLQRFVKPFLAAGTYLETDVVWTITIPGGESLEFVPNDHGVHWDKPPQGGNYVIDAPGCYFLKGGHVYPIVPPPDRPALLEASSITASSVNLVWNGPVARSADVAGYQVFRDGALIASLDDKTFEYEDRDLTGLTKYTYTVKGVNKNNVVGIPSDPLEVQTGEPGKPSEVTNLRISEHSEHSIALSWQKPFDNGGGPIEIYRIYRNGTPIAFKSRTSNEWETWTDSKVEAKQKYIYHVTACRYLPPRDSPLKQPPPPTATETTQASVARLASRLVRLPSMPLTPPPTTDDTKKLTDYLIDVIHHRDYEGLVANGVEGKAVTQVVIPRLGDRKCHIILQGFNWHSCDNKDGHYKLLESRIEKMKNAGITMLWLPPPTASVAPQGYMPTRWHDLDTAYGKEEDLRRLIVELKSNGVVPMLDAVLNHRCGVKKDPKTQDWTIFEDPDWESWAVVSNNLQGYSGQGAQDTGASSECAPDLDHTNERVRKDAKDWVNWLFNDVGFGALRIDMAPGYATRYQIEYVQSLENPFTVGEYWSGDSNALRNYTNAGKGLIAAYDFGLYYILRRAVESSNFGELSDNGKVPGLIGKDPQHSVTFIDNHDTVHLNFVGKFAGWDKDAVLRGIVYLLTHPGTPCLYLDHFFDFGDWFYEKVMALGQIRHDAKLTSECGVNIARAEHGLYSAYISRDRCCYPGNAQVAVKLGWQNWQPEQGSWNAKVFGKDFCVWTKS